MIPGAPVREHPSKREGGELARLTARARGARFSQADAARAMKAAVSAGLRPIGFEVAPDGTLRVLMDDAPKRRNTFDETMR